MDRRVAVLLLALIGAAYADQDLSVKVWFPDNPTGEFVPGKVSKAVFGLHNVDATACNVSYAGASLALPYDASSSIFNFSSSMINSMAVPADGEASVEFPLSFPSFIPPQEYYLTIYFILGVDSGYEGKLVFNQTIYVVEPHTWIDVQLIGLYLIGAAILAAIGYWAWGFALAKGFIKKQRKSKLARKPAGPVDRSDYLKGTHGHEFLRKRSEGKIAPTTQ